VAELHKVAVKEHKRRRALSLSVAPLFCDKADAILARTHDFSHITQFPPKKTPHKFRLVFDKESCKVFVMLV
jgi:hypothetical protein